MPRNYDERLSGGSYRDDVLCEIRLLPDPRDEGADPVLGWISERLLARLRYLALAYELPLLGRLPGTGSTSYPEVQLSPLEEELAFLFTVVSDDALLTGVTPIRDMIRRATHHPRGWTLTVETD